MRETVGTGYLIDSSRGYVLTAAHVVAAKIRNPGVSLTGASVAVAGPPVPMTIRRHLLAERPPVDLALLQATTPDAFGGLKPVGVAFRAPVEAESLASLGYPIATHHGLRTEPVAYSGTDRGHLVVTRTVDEGDSGGPLLDATGSVLGTCVQEVNGTTAYYLPTRQAIPLVLTIPPSPDLCEADEGIRSGQWTTDDVCSWLLTKASNLDLLLWAWHVKNAREAYAGTSIETWEVLGQAMSERSLWFASRFLDGLISSARTTQADLGVANYARAMEDWRTASAVLQKVVARLRDSIVTRAKSNPGGLTFVACQIPALRSRWVSGGSATVQFGAGGWLRTTVETGCGPQASEDPELQSLFQDYAVASVRLAKADSSRRKEWLREGAGAAAVAAAATSNQIRRGLAIDGARRRPRPASERPPGGQAYATAFQLGYQREWVVPNYDYAMSRVGRAAAAKDIGAVERLELSRILTLEGIHRISVPRP